MKANEYSRERRPDEDVGPSLARGLRPTRRGLEIALGVVWLIDGLLQFQPYMFGQQFFVNVFGMASMGLPRWIGAMPHRVLIFLYPSHAVFNAMFAAIQVLIGVGLLWRRSARLALIGSIAWGLVVWVGGEGFGGLFMPGMSMLTGAPGAVIVYVALSIILWSTRCGDGSCVAATSVLGERGVLGLWVVVWAGTALLELQLANNAPGALAANLRFAAIGEPGMLATLDRFFAHVVGLHGTETALTMALVQVMVGFQVLSRGRRRLVLSIAIGVSSLYWVVGQNTGGIFTGTGTDSSLGPSMILLALTLWPRPSRREVPQSHSTCSVPQTCSPHAPQ